MVGGPRRILVHCIQIHLVHQYPCSHAARQIADLPQDSIGGEYTRRIMQIRDDDQSCPRRQRAPDLGRVQSIPVLLQTREPFHVRAHVKRRRNQQFVGWLLDQNFIARLDQRRHSQVVRHGRAIRRNHRIRIHAALISDSPLQWCEAVPTVAIDLQVLDADR